MLSEVLGQESWMGAESGEEGMTGDARRSGGDTCSGSR